MTSIAPAQSATPSRRADTSWMLDGPIIGRLVGLAAPMVAVLVAQSIVGVAETFYVGLLGTECACRRGARVSVVDAHDDDVEWRHRWRRVLGRGPRHRGAGRQDDADALVLHAIVLAVIFGLGFTAGSILLGPRLYGAAGRSRGRARGRQSPIRHTCSPRLVPTWIANLMAAALRGVGNVRVPALVTLLGCVILVPLSPLLIFGFGPVPRFGVAGAGIAIMIYYIGASLYLGWYLLSGRGGLTVRAGRLRWALFASILKVGLISAVGTLVANLTVIVVTGLVGPFGADAIAGYGAASRLDYIQIPFLFGLGTARRHDGRRQFRRGAIRQGAAHSLDRRGDCSPRRRGDRAVCSRVPRCLDRNLQPRPRGSRAAGATYLHRVAPAYGAVGPRHAALFRRSRHRDTCSCPSSRAWRGSAWRRGSGGSLSHGSARICRRCFWSSQRERWCSARSTPAAWSYEATVARTNPL